MSATERLRKLLDSRGIEWSDRSPHPFERQYITGFKSNGFLLAAVESYEGKLELMSDYHCLITPEQVIDVACERTCRNVSEDAERCNFFKCSECGCYVEDGEYYHVYVGTAHGVELPWSYCPHCGRKVVQE